MEELLTANSSGVDIRKGQRSIMLLEWIKGSAHFTPSRKPIRSSSNRGRCNGSDSIKSDFGAMHKSSRMSVVAKEKLCISFMENRGSGDAIDSDLNLA